MGRDGRAPLAGGSLLHVGFRYCKTLYRLAAFVKRALTSSAAYIFRISRNSPPPRRLMIEAPAPPLAPLSRFFGHAVTRRHEAFTPPSGRHAAGAGFYHDDLHARILRWAFQHMRLLYDAPRRT